MLDRAGVGEDPRFVTALEAVLEVLPLSPNITGTKLTGDARAAGDDFQALYELSRLAYSDRVDEPDQLAFWRSARG